MEKWKNLKISEKIRYVIGICFIIGGFSGIASGDFFSGLLTGIFGLSLFPIVYEKLNISTEKKLHIVIPIILFLVTSIFMPSSEETINTVDTTNTVVNESVIEENKTIESEVDSSEKTEEVETATEEEPNSEEEEEEATNSVNSTVIENSTATSSSEGQATEPYNPTVEEPKEESTITTTEISKEQEIVPNNPAIEETNNEITTTAPSTPTENTDNSGTVYITPKGERYHLDSDCGGKNAFSTTLNQAINSGRTPCKKCAQ